jgi:hypothetical protein
VKNDISHREILAGDHAEEEQPDEKLELVKGMDVNTDEIEMPQSKDQAGENHGITEIQMEPSLEDDIKQKNSKQTFFYERDQHGFPQDSQERRAANTTVLLEVGDAEELDQEGISNDKQEDKDMPELKPGEVVGNQLDDVLNHRRFPLHLKMSVYL